MPLGKPVRPSTPNTLGFDIVRCDTPSRALSLTAILVIVGDVASGTKSLQCLAAQTIAADMELILASDTPQTLTDAEPALSAFGAVQLVVGDVTRLPHLRGVCGTHARAPIVAFNEDHAFVAPDWAATVVRLFAGDRRVVAAGVCMSNPNPQHPVSRAQFAAFFARYAPEAWAAGDHEVDTLPWHNTVYRAEALQTVTHALGTDLGRELEVEGTLQAHLRVVMPDCRFLLSTHSLIQHVNVSRLAPAVGHAVIGGRLFAADRAAQHRWSRWRRVVQAGGSPLAPFVRLWRDRQVLSAGARGPADAVNLWSHACLMAAGHALGEMIGLLAGCDVTHVQRYADYESRRARFVQARDRALLHA